MESSILNDSMFRAVGDISPFGVFAIDAEANCLYANQQCLKVLGLSFKQISGKGWSAALHPDEREVVFRQWADAVEKGKPYVKKERFIRPNGTVVDAIVKITAVKEGDTVRGYLGTLTDTVEVSPEEAGNRPPQQAATNSQFNLSILLENGDWTICSVDKQLNFTFFNTAYRNTIKQQYNVDVKLGDNYLDIVQFANDEHREIALDNIRRALAGEDFQMLLNIDARGRPITRSVSLSPERDMNGNITGITVMAQDISSLIKLQRENEEKTYFLNALTKNLPILVYKNDRNGINTFSVGSVLEVFGLNDNELVGKNMLDDNPDYVPHFHKAMAGERVEFTTYRDVNGKPFYLQNIVFPDPAGNGGIVGLSLDITGIKLAEKENAEKTHLLNGVLQNLPVIIYIIDGKGLFRLLLGAGLQYLGLQDNEVIGQSVFDLFPTAEDQVRRAMAGELNHFTTAIYAEGTELYFQNSVFPDDSCEGGIIGFAINVTKEKEAEKEFIRARQLAEDAAAAKQHFLSNMSHEIRTPLNSILGMTHLLLEENPTPEQRSMLEIQQFSGENLLGLVNDILDYSKVDAGKIVFENVDFDLTEFIESVKKSHYLQAEKKGILFKIRRDSELPNMVIGDRVRLSQVLNNLISNAIKFTSQGSVIVDFSLHKIMGDDVFIDFSVADTGIGIDQAQKEFIFETFTQASADTTRNFGGTGLGLAITRKLLQLQNSDITVQSEPGKGSVFSFRLKFRKSNKSRTDIKNGQHPAEIFESLSGYRVLFVEDNEINRLVASKFMRKWGLEIEYAVTGIEALEKIQQQHYDIVMLDIQMPKMDGYEAARRIRALPDEKFRKIPIVALTASALAEIKGKTLEAGMNDYISKPFHPAELYGKIRHYLQAEGASDKKTD